jgi:hypothetical protein
VTARPIVTISCCHDLRFLLCDFATATDEHDDATWQSARGDRRPLCRADPHLSPVRTEHIHFFYLALDALNAGCAELRSTTAIPSANGPSIWRSTARITCSARCPRYGVRRSPPARCPRSEVRHPRSAGMGEDAHA